MQIILASGSIGRTELLKYIGVSFDVIKSTIDEYAIIGSTPYETLKLRAKAKGEDILGKITQSSNKPITQLIDTKKSNNKQKLENQKTGKSGSARQPENYFVISADTSVIFEGKLYGKPKDRNEAEEMFTLFSGKTHEVVTATYVGEVSSGISSTLLEESITSLVTFKQLSQADINRYLNVTDYLRFAGSYAINSGQDFITKLEGSISNVVGLPLELIMPLLEKKGVLRN